MKYSEFAVVILYPIIQNELLTNLRNRKKNIQPTIFKIKCFLTRSASMEPK